MNCCQCQGIEEIFSAEYVDKELSRYRSKGPPRTTRLLTGALREAGVDGLTLLDIGGGVGAVQHALLDAGVERATDVEASAAYLRAARSEAQRRSLDGRVSFEHGNFVDLAPHIQPADIVTLDRVICCYPDMENMVSLSAARARKLYGLVYPRDGWWIQIGLALGNFALRLRGRPFRTFAHPTAAVEALLAAAGLRRRFYARTLVWQVAVYGRQGSFAEG